ncbi:hypothetical protein EJB05_37565, partial [Eragrostis curvula]
MKSLLPHELKALHLPQGKGTVTQRDEHVSSTSRDKGLKGAMLCRSEKTVEDVAELMGKYIEVKTKQVEAEAPKASQFSIKNCNALLAACSGGA